MPRKKGDPDGRMTVVEHLTELRTRLIISIVAVAVGATICFIFAPEIISFLVTYYEEATDGQRDALIFTGPLDAFATRLKIATYGGIVLAMPVWLWQLWRFITPGLNPTEKKYAVPFVVASIVPVRCAARWSRSSRCSRRCNFLLNIGGSDLQPLLTADKYMSLVSLMIVAFGISFEFPVDPRVPAARPRAHAPRSCASGGGTPRSSIVLFAAVITPSQDPTRCSRWRSPCTCSTRRASSSEGS